METIKTWKIFILIHSILFWHKPFFWHMPKFSPTPNLWTHATHAIFLTHAEILWTYATTPKFRPTPPMPFFWPTPKFYRPTPTTPPTPKFDPHHPRYLADSLQTYMNSINNGWDSAKRAETPLFLLWFLMSERKCGKRVNEKKNKKTWEWISQRKTHISIYTLTDIQTYINKDTHIHIYTLCVIQVR